MCVNLKTLINTLFHNKYAYSSTSIVKNKNPSTNSIQCLHVGEGRKRNQISVGSCSEVSLPGKVLDKDFRLLNASIQAPSGLEEPCFLKRLPNGNLGTYIYIL